MKKKRADKLLRDYLKGEGSEEDRALVETWFLAETISKNEELPEPAYKKVKDSLWTKIQDQKQKKDKIRRLKIIWIRSAVAAAILLFVGFVVLLSADQSATGVKNNEYQAKNDVAPGTNKAILTLSDGSQVLLNDAENGKVAVQVGISIIKKNGALIYQVNDQQKGSDDTNNTALNSISTPKGGKYQVSLPDGTMVWLNASSILKFPASFSETKDRQVILSGEAYFEVAKDKRPFKVVTSHQIIQVYGTHFNINSYADEQSTRTTLLEGSVKVISLKTQVGQYLKPGEQSIINDNSPEKMTITKANIDQVIAWKNGYFHFEKDNLYTVMRQLSRWYDVDIVYHTQRTDDEFMGDIPMSVNLSEVLKILNYGGVHFKIEGKKIIVTK